jgi:hypothetical protein
VERPGSFVVTAEGEAVAGEVRKDGPDALVFEPAVPLAPGTSHTAIVGIDTLFAGGRTLDEEVRWEFRTAEEPYPGAAARMNRNPFDPSLGPGVLSFPVRKAGRGTVTVYTLDGFLVRRDTIDLSLGLAAWEWDAEGDAGPCPTGTYIVKVEMPEGEFTATVGVLR